MKTFINKVTSMPKGEAERPFMLYSDLAIACLNNRPQQGFSLEEMSLRLGILKNLGARGPEEQVALEDAEANKLLTCIGEMNWGVLHEDIAAFGSDLRAELAN